jgi:uncharacterized protein
MNEQEVYDDTIYRVVHGSRAYGTHRPDSDWDEKGVCIPSNPRYYYGNLTFEQKDKGWSDGSDRSIMDLRKFVGLALKCNPNIIEILYVDESDILHMDDLGKELRDNRDIFLSRLAAATFTGYAISQLKRMRGHYDWLTKPPEEPNKDDFWKTRVLTASSDPVSITLENHVFEVTPGKQSGTVATVRHFDGKTYSAAKKRFNNYQRWLRDRNPARAELEAKHSFDVKHAYHLVRILRMGKEILGEGLVQVKRPDAAEILEIRDGKFKYEELISYAEELKEEVDSLVESSPLPEEPDFEAAEALTMRLIQKRLNG